jgi:hypothetical protein
VDRYTWVGGKWRSSGGRVEELTRAIAIDTSSGLYTYISSLNY